MRPHIILLGCAAVFLGGCGWKTFYTPIRLTGKVVEADTKTPVQEAYIDVANDREQLDLVFTTPCRTDDRGQFDTIYRYAYDRWFWLSLPVPWYKNTPERLYIEASKTGYRNRVTDIECPPLKGGKEDVPPVIAVEPINLHKASPVRRHARDE
ncbi:MAG: hypothetical protein NT045_03950 [Candidatus Aureabacteria bacterium]|nr:hypothetical protein [Candidatus Auribacterota bacterium]